MDPMTTPCPVYPALRLKPRADARRIRLGHPWAWADDLVLDRRARALPPGALVVLEDAARAPIGLGVATVNARIGWRMLDSDTTAQIDQTWINQRVDAALAHRARIYNAPYYRLVHAEGDALPGVIVDRFGDVCVIQPNALWVEARINMVCAALTRATGCQTIIKNGMARARAAEGLPQDMGTLTGVAPDEPIAVPMNGAIYMADLMRGQKTGLFYDQRPNHAFAAQIAHGARVLDVFCHVGGFGLACLAKGAASVTAIDASAPALDLAKAGAQAMGVEAQLTVRQGDAFVEMETLTQSDARFDLIIADPPAFAPSKSALQQGLRAYERVARLAAGLVNPGGIVMLCSCSHAVDLDKFRAACLRGIGRAGRTARVIHTGFAGPDHPLHPALTETGYLKALAFRLMP